MSVPALAAWPQVVLDREAAAGITRLDNGDGTFSYVPPAGLSYADQVGNHLTWRNTGQAVYSDDPQPIKGSVEYLDGSDTPDDPTEGVASLMGATRVDGYGRIWEIVAIDYPALDVAIDAYFTTADLEAGVQPVPQGPINPQGSDEAVGVGETWPNSWDSRACADADPEDDVLIHNTDDRTGFASPVTHTQSSLLHIRILLPSGAQSCSGVKVSARHVLTAAHCVSDSAGNRLSGLTFHVCSNQTSPVASCQTFSGSAGTVLISDDYSPGSSHGLGDAGDDWAILTMPGGLPDPKMYLADEAIGRSEIKRLSAERVGHDRWKLAPSGSGCTQLSHQSFEPSTAVSGTNRGTVRFKVDASNGGSGGPYFHVPPGLAAGRILGLHSASHHGPVSFQVGPRVTEIRGGVAGLIQD